MPVQIFYRQLHRSLVALGTLLFILLVVQGAFANEPEEILEITWEDLLPKKNEFWKAPIDDLDGDELDALPEQELERLVLEQKQIMHSVMVDSELNGRVVSMPGLVVPLEHEGEKIREFLLVPYHGACIHVPPPPLNQIVYVTVDEAFELKRLFEAVRITGKLETILSSAPVDGLGYEIDIGYRMDHAEVEKYIEKG